MKTVHKLILKSYFGPMLLTFFIVMFVLVMQFMWRYIDELVGKGLSLDVISELMMYASITLIPMGLPLATLLAAIMTLGNMGENYELLALKSAGISLPRILRPLVFVIVLIAIGSFFVANNLVPYSTKKIYALIYDIRQQKQSIEFKDGIFFNGIDNVSIRVGKQHPETRLLTDMLIYDTRDFKGNTTTTVADSGYISLSDDKKYLLITLYNGESYENVRGADWYDKNDLRRHVFDVQNMVLPLVGFDFERTDESMFSGSQTRNIAELEFGIDSLQHIVSNQTVASYTQFLQSFVFQFDHKMAQDTVKYKNEKRKVTVKDSIDNLDVYRKRDLLKSAMGMAVNSRGSSAYDETNAKDALDQLYRFKVEWHRKMSLPISIVIFFLIGAPLGAIIRKGGLGMPIVVSVSFFVVYYIISITGEKMAREGSWESFTGMWISTFVLLPISVFLTYKATNDSNLFNSEWYFGKIKSIKKFLKKFKKDKI